MTNSTEPISKPNSSEEVQTTMPDLPSRSISSVSSLTCLESEPWCNSTLSNVFCFSIDDKRSDSPLELVNSKLTPSQWRRSVCYKALADYIFPMLSKFRDPDTGEGKDSFQVQMDYYTKKYAEEFQAVLRDGVEYDEDSSGTVTASEKEPIHHLRLQR